MKKYIIYIIIATLSIGFYSCNNEEDIDPNSIFGTEVERNEFDYWLLDNYTRPYNIRVIYKFEDVEAPTNYYLVPVTMQNAIRMAKIVRYLWLDVYDEAVNVEFTRSNVPKMLQFIGSGGFDSKGTYVLGTAEGGMKITLFNLNELNPSKPADIKESYFKTIHHEFAHVLHQKKNYDTDYQKISLGNYVMGDWYLYDETTAFNLGFCTRYARHSPNEDFVETYSVYVVRGRDNWANNILAKASAEGREKMEQKLEMVRKYMSQSWGIDIEKVHDIIQRRATELPLLDLDKL